MIERIGADAVVAVAISGLVDATVNLAEGIFDLLDMDEQHAFEKLMKAFVVRLIAGILVTFKH